MLIILVQWKSQEAFQSIMSLRVASVKKQYAAEALLKYGIDIAKEQHLTLVGALEKRGTPLTLTFNRWPLGGGDYAAGTLEISFKKALKITAFLSEQGKKQISFSCILEKEAQRDRDFFIISSWNRDSI